MTILDPGPTGLSFRAFYTLELANAFLRQKNPRRRQAATRLDEFHQRIWRDAAHELGASYVELGHGFGEVVLDGRRTRVSGRLAPLDDPVTLRVAGHRPMTYRLLAEAGLPVPRHAAFSVHDPTPALEFLRRTPAHCVVKPAVGTGEGRAVTTGISGPGDLARATAVAAIYGDDLLIEEEVEGANYRLLYLDGKLLDAYVRLPPTVVGNGRDSVRTLLRHANAERARAGLAFSKVQVTADLELRRTLARQALSLRSVPPKGRTVTLKTVVNENAAQDNVAAAHLLSDSVVATGATAAAALGVRLAGVDVITTDPSVPLSRSGGVVLEVNTTPGLYYHYQKRGGSCPVARHVLRTLLMSEVPPVKIRMGPPCR